MMLSGDVPEIGHDQHDAAALQELLEVAHGLGEIGAGARFGLFQTGHQTMQLALTRGGADIVADLVVEGNQPGGIALAVDGQIEQRRGEVAGVIHFVDAVRAKLHGVAGVEQDGQHAVGFAAIAPEIHPLGAGVDVPIDVAKIVAGIIGAIFGELLAETKVGRAVQAGDEAIDHGLGDQIEAGDGGEDGGIEEALVHEKLSAVGIRPAGKTAKRPMLERTPIINESRGVAGADVKQPLGYSCDWPHRSHSPSSPCEPRRTSSRLLASGLR